MFVSEALWAIIGIGVILLGAIMVYGMMRNRRRPRRLDPAREQATREMYHEERQ